MTVRLRRLQAEYERLKIIFDGHPHISITETSGRPPDRYVVEYRVKGLVESNGEIGVSEVHRAEISLGENYPREMARCVMLTPVFHPNIDHLSICTEDIGAAGKTLDKTIIFIGEMISFQTYNLQSPRNGDAARWTKENAEQLPLDHVDLVPAVLLRADLEVEVAVAAAAALAELALETPAEREAEVEVTQPPPLVATTTTTTATHDTGFLSQCANCSQTAALDFCTNSHLICTDCRLTCANCLSSVCCMCAVQMCATCQQTCCADCAVPCSHCTAWECLSHVRQCSKCLHWKCLAHIHESGLCDSCARIPAFAGTATMGV